MSCRKVYQASEANKLFLMRIAGIHGEGGLLHSRFHCVTTLKTAV